MTGYVRSDAFFCRSGRRGGESCYTPLTSSPDSRRVAVLLAERAPSATGPQRFEGFLNDSSQSSFARDISAAGLQPAARVVRLLPESQDERSVAGSMVSLVGIAMFLLGWFWLRRVR